MKLVSIFILAFSLQTLAAGEAQLKSTIINGNLSVGNSASADTTAVVDFKSTTKGALLPRMTTTQRDNISSPATGLTIYNTSTNKTNVYNGSGWVEIASTSETQTFTNKTFDADGTGNSISNIENADIKASAAIARTKLATGTASRALVNSASGDITESAVTATELGYLSGVTSAVQTQLDAKGDASGPASSVDSEIALFSGAGGKTLKRATGSGFVKATSGVFSTQASISLSADVSDTVSAANGGTGRSTLTSNAVVLGNGANPVNFVSGSVSGDVLTYNGTTWTAASLSGANDVQSSTAGAVGIEYFGWHGGNTSTACTGTCTVFNNSTAVTGVTRTGAGAYEVAIDSGTFSAVPICTGSGQNPGVAFATCLTRFDVSTATLVKFYCGDGGSGINVIGGMVCVGPK